MFLPEAEPREFVQSAPEQTDVFRKHRDAGSHRVTAMGREEIAAFAQSGRQIETGHAPPRTAHDLAPATDNQCGPMKLSHDAGSDDSHDTEMPIRVPFDNHEIPHRIEPVLDRFNDLGDDPAFNGLTF